MVSDLEETLQFKQSGVIYFLRLCPCAVDLCNIQASCERVATSTIMTSTDKV